MIPYEHTTISMERTKADIEKLLRDNGVEDLQWTTYHGDTTLRFIWKIIIKGLEKEIAFQFTPPIIESKRRVWSNTDQKYIKANVQLQNTSYRLLWHYLTEKLKAVKWGLITMEKEFLSHAVVSLPNGQVTTVGEEINKVYDTVRSPSLEYKAEKPIIDV